MSSGRVTGRVVGSAVAGAVLIPLALVLAFWRPQRGQVGHVALDVLSWGGLRLVQWAALAGGAWLLAYAWLAWRGHTGEEPEQQEA